MDYDDPKTEEQWCSEPRSEIAAYLAAQTVTHGQVGDWPAWHLAPYVSIWAVESLAKPGWVGWWAICGDLPTDYLAADPVKHPRDALLGFVSRWRRAAELMARGESLPGFSIGPPAEWPALSPMLASRAELLQDMAADAGCGMSPNGPFKPDATNQTSGATGKIMERLAHPLRGAVQFRRQARPNAISL